MTQNNIFEKLDVKEENMTPEPWKPSESIINLAKSIELHIICDICLANPDDCPSRCPHLMFPGNSPLAPWNPNESICLMKEIVTSELKELLCADCLLRSDPYSTPLVKCPNITRPELFPLPPWKNSKEKVDLIEKMMKD